MYFQSGLQRISFKIIEVISSSRAESDEHSSIGGQMSAQLAQCRQSFGFREESDDISGRDDEVEFGLFPCDGEFSQVAHLPLCFGIIFAGDIDQVPVKVHAHDLMPLFGQPAAYAAGTASGIQDPAAAGSHRVNRAGFPENILAFRSKRAPALGEILRVVRIFANSGEPQVFFWCGHSPSFALSPAFSDSLAELRQTKKSDSAILRQIHEAVLLLVGPAGIEPMTFTVQT